jgi:hypothetical protein
MKLLHVAKCLTVTGKMSSTVSQKIIFRSLELDSLVVILSGVRKEQNHLTTGNRSKNSLFGMSSTCLEGHLVTKKIESKYKFKIYVE